MDNVKKWSTFSLSVCSVKTRGRASWKYVVAKFLGERTHDDDSLNVHFYILSTTFFFYCDVALRLYDTVCVVSLWYVLLKMRTSRRVWSIF